MPRADLDAYIVKEVGDWNAQDVEFLIYNVSFSKEDRVRKGLAPEAPTPVHLEGYLDVLMDDDRLEAIRQIGTGKCIAY